MLDLNTAQEYWIGAEPTDMRKGRDSLAAIVRQKFGKDPKMGGRAFIFYPTRAAPDRGGHKDNQDKLRWLNRNSSDCAGK